MEEVANSGKLLKNFCAWTSTYARYIGWIMLKGKTMHFCTYVKFCLCAKNIVFAMHLQS